MKILLITAALAVSLSAPAWALPQPVGCSPHAHFTHELKARYGEVVIDEMTVIDGHQDVIMQLWANPQTMSWTITGYVDGLPNMCLFDSGDNYHDVTLNQFLSASSI